MWKSIRQAFTDCSKIFGRCGGFNQFIVQDLEYLVPQEHDVNAPVQQHEPEPPLVEETEEYRGPCQHRPNVLKFGKCLPEMMEMLHKALSELGVDDVSKIKYTHFEDYFIPDGEQDEYNEDEDWKDSNFEFIFENGPHD